MGSIITISITGYVGSEPQLRQVGEQHVVSFSVAVNRRTSNGNEQTLWIRANVWNKLADVAIQYVNKGSLVQLTTEWLRPSAWIDDSGKPQVSIDVDANRLVLLDRVNGAVDDNDSQADGNTEDEIPF